MDGAGGKINGSKESGDNQMKIKVELTDRVLNAIRDDLEEKMVNSLGTVDEQTIKKQVRRFNRKIKKLGTPEKTLSPTNGAV